MRREKYLYFALLWMLWSCDLIVNKEPPKPAEEQVPQWVVETVRWANPTMSNVTLTRFVQDIVWTADFPTPSSRSLLLIDNEGEILSDNQIIGHPKSLPAAIKSDANARGTIQNAALIKHATNGVMGYLVEVKQANNLLKKLRYNDAAFEAEVPLSSPLQVREVYLTTTDMLATDARVPTYVQKFFKDNQLSGANVALYYFDNQTTKIIITYYQREKKSILSEEVYLDQDGKILEWIVPIEREVTFATVMSSELPSAVNTLIAQTPSFNLNYAIAERFFGKTNAWKIRGKNANGESFWIFFEEQKNQLKILKNTTIQSSELPANALQNLSNQWVGWQWRGGQKRDVVGGSTEKYIAQISVNNDLWTVVFDRQGKMIFQYKKN
jgi:hypothetical protein